MWDALNRVDTAISASCSIVVPYSCMCRRAAIAYLAINACPNGESNCTGPRPPNDKFALRLRALRSARVVDPYTSTTTSAWPARIAAVACSTMNSHVEPPTPVPSTHVGRRPRYSPISTGESRPVPLDANPSMSFFVRPASAMARDAAW